MRKKLLLVLAILTIIGISLLVFKDKFFSDKKEDEEALKSSVTYEGTTNFNNEAAKIIEGKEKLLNPPPNPAEKAGMFLKIPKIGVDWHVLDGSDADKLLLQGFWHYPNTPTPNNSGNTIILGHRWVYKAPDKRTLYSLDKLKAGDPIFVIYDKKTYKYEMTESFITDAKDPRQTEAFNDPMLTLITSHPIEEAKIISKQRLVVRAKMVPNQ